MAYVLLATIDRKLLLLLLRGNVYYYYYYYLYVCFLIGQGTPHQLTADWRCLRVECRGGEETQNLAQELRRVIINGDSNWG